MKTIAVASLKGGVGKSTVAVLLARWLSAADKRVVLIDSDIQASATSAVAVGDGWMGERSLARGYTERNLPAQLVAGRWGIAVIPADFDLMDLRAINPGRLRSLIGDLPDEVDYVVIDCAAGYDNHLLAAIEAADVVLTPVEDSLWTLRATEAMIEHAREDARGFRSDITVIFRNKVRSPHSQSAQEYQRLYREVFGESMSAVVVPATAPMTRAIDRESVVSAAREKERAYRALTMIYQRASGLDAMPERF